MSLKAVTPMMEGTNRQSLGKAEVTSLRIPMRSRWAYANDAHGDSDFPPAWEPDYSVELEFQVW